MKIDRVREIYADLEKYEIRLEHDPIALGPKYLQTNIAQCRNYLNLVSRFQLEVHREKQDLSRRLHADEVSYEVAFNEMLSNDERVRRLPSIEDRKATVGVMLRDQMNNIAQLKAEMRDLEYVEKAVKHRHKELTASMSDIKAQRSIIQAEIDTGTMYGDERRMAHEQSTNRGGPLGDDIDEDELASMLEDGERELASPDESVTTASETGSDPEDAPVSEKAPDVIQAIDHANDLIQALNADAPMGKVLHGALVASIIAEANAIDSAKSPEIRPEPEEDDEAKVRDFLDTASGPPADEDFEDLFDKI